MHMNDSELRRRELLRQTRKLYDERQEVPAVHPRYGNIYRSLYDGEEEHVPSGGSFYIRLAVGILCFICFVYMDRERCGCRDDQRSLEESVTGGEVSIESQGEVR